MFNTETRAHGIDYVLDKLTGDNIDKDRLK